ncbi:MAG: hypothetical protein KKB31_03270 [Nanoarchaeota archaeon]|nr:hypothetical protein [Nanoarchaeota archaeon]
MNFIRKVFEKKVDESTHRQFTRFGKGEYKGRFFLGFTKTKKIKVKSSFEFANDLVEIAAGFGEARVSGIVLSKKDISEDMSKKGIQCNAESKKGGLYYENQIPVQDLKPAQTLELEKASYFSLLDIEGEDFRVKMKKKLPKPGKDERKIDDKFCQLEADEKYCSKIKEDLFWDLPEVKKASIKHSVIIGSIIMPQGEKDYAKIRELSKRKGKLIRHIDADGQTTQKETTFEA